MQDLVINITASFVTSVTFAELISVPRDCQIQGGLIGALGWAGYYSLNRHNGSVFTASVLCALILTVCSHAASRKYQRPTLIFFVPGMVPVVPGITFFHAFQALMVGEYSRAGFIFLDVLYTAVGIACGLGISAVFIRCYYGLRRAFLPKQGSQ